MQLTFLQSGESVPLTKRWTKKDSRYEKESYVIGYKVSSHVEDGIETPEDFLTALKKHAGLGHCLHTGSLSKVLDNESRAKQHDKDEEREWIVLDLDGLENFSDVETFLKELPEAFQDTTYIVQQSSSAGIKPGLRAHVFFLLDRPEHMREIKLWVNHMNLVTEKLRDAVTLGANSDFHLSYPLDRIANDNGRVIYIAPPICVGFKDPLADRIVLVKKDHDRLRHNFKTTTRDEVRKLERAHIDKLRKDAGLPSKTRMDSYYESRGEIDVLKRNLTNPGRVRPIKKDSDFIMRCNLDDGDSEAYFYFIDRPQLIRNHKGEPAIYMEKFDPEYYNKVAMPAAREMWERNKQPFVFRNKNDDRWYAGSRIGNEIIDQPHMIGSEAKIEGWFRQISLGIPAPGADDIETWEVKFNPTLEAQWNPDERVFNTWRKTEIMKNATYRSLPPAVITKIISHVTGGAEEYERFINWLAYVYQYRQKTGTAWIFHGIQGTGKGLLVDHIITPILGHDYVAKQQSRNLKAEFNSFLEKSLIVNLDEFDLYDAGHEAGAVMQALKMWITDTRLPLRRMYAESQQVDNFSNFIITTNSQNSIPVQPGNRRLQFGVRQEEKLQITHEEVESIKDELEHFAGYLSGYEVNKADAHTVLENDALRQAMEISRNSVEEFADAIRYGNIHYFIALLSEPAGDNFEARKEFKELVSQWASDAKAGRRSLVPATRMIYAYMVATGDSHKTVTKFKKTMAHKALAADRIWLPDKTRPDGWSIDWQLDDQDKVDLGIHLKPVKSAEDKLKNELQAPISPPNMET